MCSTQQMFFNLNLCCKNVTTCVLFYLITFLTFQLENCQDNSGNPVIRQITNSARKKPYFQQEFITSKGIGCQLGGTVFTRISNRDILYWIQQVTNTFPLVMVVGGYNTEKELLTDVELISGEANNVCSKNIRPIYGRVSYINTFK